MKAVAGQSGAYAIGAMVGVSTYLYRRQADTVLMLVNANVDVLENPTLQIGGIAFTKIKRLCRDGSFSDCRFVQDGDEIVLNDTLDYLSSSVYVLE